ncbi:MAG: hypothetical protein NVS3B21_35960 [Acidimicrobiales bacterium]
MAAAGAALITGMFPAVSARAATTPTVYSIGVDNSSPAGRNFEYVDFFPRSGVSIHSGDVLNFGWNPASVDGFHNVAVLPTSQTESQARQAYPLVVPDTSDGPNGGLEFNPFINTPTFPPSRSHAPGACGDVASPCTFDGAKLLNSGAFPTSFGPSFAVKVAAPVGSYTAICLVHNGMAQSFSVVADSSPASTAADLQSAATSQHDADTAAAQTATAAVQSTTSSNADGTRTLTVQAGLNVAHVDVDEMLPQRIDVRPGDQVKWNGSFLHTVTFPRGVASSGIDPFPFLCEGPSGKDTPATGPPPDGGCAGGPPALEIAFDPAPHGPATILRGGYRIGAADGGVFDYGNAPYLGSASQFHPVGKIVATVPTFDGAGYWQVGDDGGVFAFGDAPFLGSAATLKKTAPIVGLVAAPDSSAYGLIGADGNLYLFGNVPPFGGGPIPGLAAPVVGGVASGGQNGPGALLAAADGGVFAEGGATFLGSAGNLHLAKPIVGIAGTPDGGGYWLVAADGGIFSFGDAGFFGSLGATRLNAPVTGMIASATGHGYQLVAADGGVFTFGDAPFEGSAGNLKLAAPVNSIGVVPITVASSGVLGGPHGPFPTEYSFTFPDKGTFTYQCRIHDHMVGVIVAG